MKLIILVIAINILLNLVHLRTLKKKHGQVSDTETVCSEAELPWDLVPCDESSQEFDCKTKDAKICCCPADRDLGENFNIALRNYDRAKKERKKEEYRKQFQIKQREVDNAMIGEAKINREEVENIEQLVEQKQKEYEENEVKQLEKGSCIGGTKVQMYQWDNTLICYNACWLKLTEIMCFDKGHLKKFYLGEHFFNSMYNCTFRSKKLFSSKDYIVFHFDKEPVAIDFMIYALVGQSNSMWERFQKIKKSCKSYVDSKLAK
jgi:hypothetical protein